ncbi:hypothetical protein OY671_008236, partial [Metschnikowia pulcherrima]
SAGAGPVRGGRAGGGGGAAGIDAGRGPDAPRLRRAVAGQPDPGQFRGLVPGWRRGSAGAFDQPAAGHRHRAGRGRRGPAGGSVRGRPPRAGRGRHRRAGAAARGAARRGGGGRPDPGSEPAVSAGLAVWHSGHPA